MWTSREGPIREATQPATVQGLVDSNGLMQAPWYRFLADITDLANLSAITTAAEWTDDVTTTNILGAAQHYRYTGPGSGTLVLMDNILDQGSATNIFQFSIKDESAVAGTFPLTITTNGPEIDGGSSVTINQNLGSLTLYSNGVGYFTIN